MYFSTIIFIIIMCLLRVLLCIKVLLELIGMFEEKKWSVMKLQSRNRGMRNVIKIESESRESNGHENSKRIVRVQQQVVCGVVMLLGPRCAKRKTWINAKKRVTGVNHAQHGHTTRTASCMTKNYRVWIYFDWKILLSTE